MGSAAFGNVARAALGFARDTEAEDGSCVISQAKNNLGRLDLPSLRYRIDPASVDTDEGPAEVGKLIMLGESDRRYLTSSATVPESRSAANGTTPRTSSVRRSARAPCHRKRLRVQPRKRI